MPYLLVFGGCAAVMALLAWLGVWARRRGAGMALMGPHEEIWRPTAHEARFVIEEQAEAQEAMPSADDKPYGT